MRPLCFVAALILSAAPLPGAQTISNGKIAVTPLGERGAYTGFRLETEGKLEHHLKNSLTLQS